MARPPYQPTVEDKKRVSIAAGAGMSHQEIALGMGIARETLEKYFDFELSIGAYQRRMEVLEAVHTAASKGNVAAAREFLKQTPAVAPPPLANDLPQPEGKKAQANAAAKTAQLGSEWSGLLPGPADRH